MEINAILLPILRMVRNALERALRKGWAIDPLRDIKKMKKLVGGMTQVDYVTLCQTVFGEARGESRLGRIGIVHAILNRVEKKSWYGKSVKAVCLKDQQFSCWLKDDPNSAKAKGMSWYNANDLLIYRDVNQALSWWADGIDITKGATHYHTTSVHPFWSKGKDPITQIGVHKYYKNID
jgi:spore germination cell wall hydrolase CwlJ-like protein